MSVMRCVLAGATLATVALSAPAAVAQTPEQVQWCTTAGTPPDKQIIGCTAMITSKEYKGDKLAVIYSRRGNAYSVKKDYDRAIADYNESILRDISNTDTFYNRGLVYRRKGNYDHAITDLNHAIAGFNSEKHPLYFKRDYFKARGDAYRGKEDFERAIADYSEAIKLDPKYARAFYNRGEVKRKIGDAVGGDADFAQATQLQENIGPED